MPDATSLLNEISGALDTLANQAIGMIGEDRPFMEMWGWNMPATNRIEFADYIKRPQISIRKALDKNISDPDFARLSQIPQRVEFIRNQVLGNLPGGNAQNVYLVISSLVDLIESTLSRYIDTPLDLEALSDRRILPSSQIRELRKIDTAIDRLGYEKSEIDRKLLTIQSAYDVASTVPSQLHALSEARDRYNKSEADLREISIGAAKDGQSISAIHDKMQKLEEAAELTLQRANAAYSAATTVGLGAAFSERAASLSRSTIILGIFLIAALAGGGFITYMRVEFVHQLMMKPNIDYNILWINVTFTALSVSAPVWLAWLLTRQIGQRFRLAEDYGYKATVAKAYEGYRAEAAQIDQELAKKLFSIALERLGEAPLRLVEKDSPGSPIHEADGPIRRWLFPERRAKKEEAAIDEEGHP